MPKISITSLGCPKNLTDTEEMLGLLAQAGYTPTPREDEADAVLLNTCGFIRPAVKESEAEMRRLIRLKTAGKIKKIVVAGCLVEREKDNLARRFPEIDAFVGLGSISKIAEALKTRKNYFGPVSRLLRSPGRKVPVTMAHSAYLKIADGCDNRCSYCTIPLIRGAYHSKPVEDVIAEAREMAQRGVKEISLVAQDTTSYGKDLYGKPRLVRLLRGLAKVKGVKWIRLMYAYPERVTDELLHFMASESKICRYLDIPLQHISDPVLKSMKRLSTEKLLREKIARIRKIVPGIALRTNFIVGYPGETESDFEKLKRFVKTAEFDSLGVFAYCREKGTPAAMIKGQIPEKIKARRCGELIDVQSRVIDGLNRKITGMTVPVLLDGPEFGRTQKDAPDIDGSVQVESRKPLKSGDFIQVRITQARGYVRKGVAVEK